MVTISCFDTMVDLLLFYMVDFEVILGMYYLSSYHAILECHAEIMNLTMPELPRQGGEGPLSIP